MGRRSRHQKSDFTRQNQSKRNIASLLENIEGPTNNLNSNYNNNINGSRNDCLPWWDELMIICNSRACIYSPRWSRLCSECGSQLLLSEPKNFCCNPMLRRVISLLRPLPLALRNLYTSNVVTNFSHFSRQYNSLFSFTTFGYTGGVVHLPHPHAFAINARNCNANQHSLDQNIVDIITGRMNKNRNSIDGANMHKSNILFCIEQELAVVNPFIQDLYRLRDTNYPQARLVIQQLTADAEIAACTIVHSTAVLAVVNPFIQDLYRLRDTNYPQARLVIQQLTADAEIAACTIVHSTAVV
ncbi:hypothetical protein Glove_339g17 [Diversispora epigaea]|uniref:Uncharacterized protein n=1 Tax=Diversispora epigaea TaxID=1348612 RepID=A0A397HI36_9GLOM|nr:hypothetical protein Glove_339g17 [Diversispora epigaea]